MNPQNKGENQIRHSILWRQPIFSGSSSLPKINCESQLLQNSSVSKVDAKSFQSWKKRSNSIISNKHEECSSQLKSSVRQQLPEESLRVNKKSSKERNSMLKNISENYDVVLRNRLLQEGMRKLQQMDLLDRRVLNHVKFPGIIKHEHVYNDYHKLEANAGYSRNYMGKFYTK